MTRGLRRSDGRLGVALVAPVLVIIAVVVLFPALWAGWESLHAHDLRRGDEPSQFVGRANYAEALDDRRFVGAVGRTLCFVVVSVSLELALGLVFALALDGARRGTTLVRTAALLPWAMPTVVTALIWRFLFEPPEGLAQRAATLAGIGDPSFVWLADPVAAWVPVILADVWKTTPFVTVLLLAGLQSIDDSLYEAARADGAGAWDRFRHVTLPLLRPALFVAVLFRTLDGLRVFDLVYVLTGGGPGTATEPVALHIYQTLLQNLRFGYGSALSVIVFGLSLGLAIILGLAVGRRTETAS